ncbi:MAG: pyridoxamine 5'-phosphate oxidase family protein [Vicingaceae bacterium]
MDKNILKYLEETKVLTLATCVDNTPYCANCFYVFDAENNFLIFLSDDKTRHITEAMANNKVAGTIDKAVTTVAKIQGLQFTGTFINPTTEEQQDFYKVYYDKFPFAKAKPAPVWGIKLNWLKMTDNTLGFGKKLKWER